MCDLVSTHRVRDKQAYPGLLTEEPHIHTATACYGHLGHSFTHSFLNNTLIFHNGNVPWGRGGSQFILPGFGTPWGIHTRPLSHPSSLVSFEHTCIYIINALNVNSPQSSLVRRLSAKKRLSKSESKSVLIATKAVCLESRGLQSDNS